MGISSGEGHNRHDAGYLWEANYLMTRGTVDNLLKTGMPIPEVLGLPRAPC